MDLLPHSLPQFFLLDTHSHTSYFSCVFVSSTSLSVRQVIPRLADSRCVWESPQEHPITQLLIVSAENGFEPPVFFACSVCPPFIALMYLRWCIVFGDGLLRRYWFVCCACMLVPRVWECVYFFWVFSHMFAFVCGLNVCTVRVCMVYTVHGGTDWWCCKVWMLSNVL